MSKRLISIIIIIAILIITLVIIYNLSKTREKETPSDKELGEFGELDESNIDISDIDAKPTEELIENSIIDEEDDIDLGEVI